MERDLQIWLIIIFLALLIAIQIFVIAFLTVREPSWKFPILNRSRRAWPGVSADALAETQFHRFLESGFQSKGVIVSRPPLNVPRIPSRGPGPMALTITITRRVQTKLGFVYGFEGVAGGEWSASFVCLFGCFKESAILEIELRKPSTVFGMLGAVAISSPSFRAFP